MGAKLERKLGFKAAILPESEKPSRVPDNALTFTGRGVACRMH
jgi:hypothetical protein